MSTFPLSSLFRFAFAPVFLVEYFRLAAGNCERIPVVAGLDAGEAEEYQHQVMDRSYPILVKAYRIYYYGDHLARTQRSDSKYAVLLAERVHALDLEGITVDDLDLAPDVLKR